MQVLADGSIDPLEHALARSRLTGKELDDAEVDRLSPDELATLGREALAARLIPVARFAAGYSHRQEQSRAAG